jgi:serine/threonine-protein kinase
MDRPTFLDHLRRSKLLSEWEIQEVTAQLPEGEKAGPLARALIARGLLTRFQARMLLAGRSQSLFLGQYRLLEELGSGGMAKVYKAAHRTMERIVAIKVLPARMLKDRLAYSLFLREVRAAARLHHPNIVMAYDANRARGGHFLVMEFVDGPNLRQLVKESGPLPVSLACDLMRQAANGLQHAHERHMVHRDIKPANLLIARPAVRPAPDAPADAETSAVNGTPVLKVVDFGLARIRGNISAASDTIRGGTGSVLGTLDYISPEQANNIHDADIRSDLYSLGCTFYFVLTGQVPFPGGTGMTKVLKHLMEEPRPVEALRPEVPPAVAAIIRRLLLKDRAERFQTPAELARQLAPWCKSLPVRHEPQAQVDAPSESAASAQPALASTPAPEMQKVAEEPVSLPELAPLSLSQLRQKWWRWTAIVELTYRCRARSKIAPEAFRAVQRELVEACRAGQITADPARRSLFERLEGLVKPWVHLRALLSIDQELHCDLLRYCLAAGQELHAWMRANQVDAESSETILGGVPEGFKNRKEWLAFQQRVRKILNQGQ